MSEIKLLPCPFCGGEAIVYEDEQYNQYMIGCKNCCAVEPMTEWTSKENAIAQWNTRKPMQEIVERLEEVSFLAEVYYASEECDRNTEECVLLTEAIEIVKGSRWNE